MSYNELIISEEVSKTQAAQARATEKEKEHQPSPDQDGIMAAYFVILEAVSIQQQTAERIAKEYECGIQVQIKLNNQAAQENFVQLTWNQSHVRVPVANANGHFYMKTTIKKIGSQTLQTMQMENQQIEKQRNDIANQVMIAQQNAQVDQTQLNTTVNNQQQSTQIDSGLMQMLLQVTNQIDTLNP